MNLAELQVELRHFAAERDWQPFHTPKNLSTALMVEAAELAEIFQWMTPEASRLAHQDAATRQRIGEEAADVLLYLLQVADHSQIDLARAVQDKLARNALKYPATRSVLRATPAPASVPGTHVLLDYENVQPTEAELRALVPDAGQVWVFHGPQQRQVEQRFASFGSSVTAVPISRSGKNALDFQLSFYLGYIASRNRASGIVVVANDKGYEPMLEHAQALGFVVRRLGHGPAQPLAPVEVPAAPRPAAAKKAAAKLAAKKAPAGKTVARQPAVKQAPAKKTVARKTAAAPGVEKAPVKKAVPAKKAPPKPADPSAAGNAATALPDAAASIRKLTDTLRKMGDSRPTKPASLWRALKSYLGADASEDAVEAALGRLIANGVVKVDYAKGVWYPKFGPDDRPATGPA